MKKNLSFVALAILGMALSAFSANAGGIQNFIVDLTSQVIGTLPRAHGGTEATTAAGARVSLGVEDATNQARLLPAGTTAQAPATPAEGMLRDNTTLHMLEAYINGGWQQVVSAVNGLVNLTSQVTGVLPEASGGTNNSTALTQGSIVFKGATGYTQDNASLNFNDSTDTLTAKNLTLTNALPVASGGTCGTGAVREAVVNATLALTDCGNLIKLNKDDAITLTVPLNAAVPFAIGAQVNVIQYGAGAASIVATAGVDIRYASTLNFVGQWSRVVLTKIGTDEWVADGMLQ